MKYLLWCVSLALFLLCSSCSKHEPPRLANFTEDDLRRELTNGMARQDVVRLFGEPVTEMETSDIGYMLRFNTSDWKASQQNGEFIGLEAFFVKDALTRWRAWKSGDPALPESR